MAPLSPRRLVLALSALSVFLIPQDSSPDVPPLPGAQERRLLVSAAAEVGDLREWIACYRPAALIVELTDSARPDDYRRLVESARGAGVPLYGWIEVARQPQLAREHPEWLAGLGHHDDWRARFPGFAKAAPDEVVKVWPWVTIWYQEAYDWHRERVGRLLSQAPELAGLYLCDIQGAPSSCGCGNDQCRWAQDYHVASTATKRESPETPAQFLADVRRLLPGRPVIPVWCIECEQIDQENARPGTGYCGSVGCFQGLCWKEHFRQLAPVVAQADQRLAIAAFSGEFRRRGEEYSGGTGWIGAAVETLRVLPPRHKVDPLPAGSLEPVIQGWGEDPQRIDGELRQAAAAGCRSAVIALTPVDQSWRPLAHVVQDGQGN